MRTNSYGFGARGGRWQATLGSLALALTAASVSAQPTAEPAAPAEGQPTPAGDDPAAADPAAADATDPGAAGACTPSCRPGFACVDGQCVSACNPPCGVGERCTGDLQCVPDTGRDPAAAEEFALEKPEEPDPDTDLVGVRAFGGFVLGGGASMHSWRTADGQRLNQATTWASFMFALRAGLFVNRNEISIEFAPSSYQPIMGEARPGELEDALDNERWITSFLGSYAHHIPITKGAYWPMRFGAGFIHRGHGSDQDGVDFQARIDLLNISVKTKFILLDFSFPSVRYASNFGPYHRWTGLFTGAVSVISQ